MSQTTLEDIERRARDGDADAQYVLAGVMAQRRQGDIARRLIESAAAQGHADALFTLAGAILTKTEASAEERPRALNFLRQARAKGSASALRLLAALTASDLVDGEGWSDALALMREACERGDPAALREIATILFVAGEDDADAGALLCAAAENDAIAGAIIGRRTERGRQTRPGRVDFNAAFAKLAGPDTPAAAETVSDRPRAVLFRRFLRPEICDHLMATAGPRLRREQVLGFDGQRRTHPHRTSTGAIIGFGFADMPSVYAGREMARLAGLPYRHGEPISILRYRQGQEYRIHYDFLGPNDPDLAAHGQRLKTALLYLNEGYEGGETHFIAPDLRFSGVTGDILVFDNVGADGEPDFKSRHAGLEIRGGEKWLASLWLRDRPFSG